MFAGKYNDTTAECFPRLPPAKAENSCYDTCRSFDCISQSLPLQVKSSHQPARWAAKTYDFFMTPPEWCDRVLFKIICCGSR